MRFNYNNNIVYIRIPNSFYLTISFSVTVLEGFFTHNSCSFSVSFSDGPSELLALDNVSLTLAGDPSDLRDLEDWGGLGAYFFDKGLELKSLDGGDACLTFTFPNLALSCSFFVLPDSVLSLSASLNWAGPQEPSVYFLFCSGGGRSCLQYKEGQIRLNQSRI